MRQQRLFQINITANWGSHGKIAERIGRLALERGWESHMAYGRRAGESALQLYRIGSMADECWHGLRSRFTDGHGLYSKTATRHLINHILQVRPTLIHLHNVHGYYLHYPLLFQFLKEYGVPVVWTLHDCWAFTGHCAHYTFLGCDRWKTVCHHCPGKASYPRSWWKDASERNFFLKKQSFTSLPRLTLVPVSQWLDAQLEKSFLHNVARQVIHNGIDFSVFRVLKDRETLRRKWHIAPEERVVLGVASCWYRKGLEHFTELRAMVDEQTKIIVVGVSAAERKHLPKGVVALERTDSVQQLVELYNVADVFFNPTHEDTLPTTNIEALACGTPVVTFDVGGSGEVVQRGKGRILAERSTALAYEAMKPYLFCESSASSTVSSETERQRLHQQMAEHFDDVANFSQYMTLYDRLLGS